MFKLCRKDKSSITRHNTRRHNGSQETAVIKSFYDKDEVVSRARGYLLRQEKECSKKKSNGDAKQDPKQPKVPLESSNRSLTSAKSSETILSEPITLQTSLLETLVTRESEDNDINVESTNDLGRDNSLHAKVDKLLSEIKVLREQTSTKMGDPAFPSPFAAVDSKCPKDVAESMLKWPDGKNLIDLTSICSHLRFFSGDAENGVLSVLRCETCYNFL